jgi:23S rRNA U2552 (ribose-2'-O)-methylase RlmE/FtsJ
MYSYKIACRNYPVPEIKPQEKKYDLCSIIHYFTADMYKISKISRASTYGSLASKHTSPSKKQFIENKSREWLRERLNKLMLGTSCINVKCQSDLRAAKSLIESGHNNFFWDRVRVLANPYELIYFTSKRQLGSPQRIQHVAAIEPLSRSFFKMVEMSRQLLGDIITTPLPVTCVGLAEGPGGFIEALIWLRSTHSCPSTPSSRITNYFDKYYGITLIDTDTPDIPSWKRSTEFLRDHPEVNILTGADGTGNLYSLKNLRYLASRFTITKADLVTADGGFDFSSNGVYNCQEQTASKLILAEIIGCMAVLGRGGRFVCKFFDLNNKLTADFLYLLQCHFTELVIFKPKTSRLANSEKYIIATGFKGCSSIIFEKLLGLLDMWNQFDISNEQVISQISTNWHIASSKHTDTVFRTINSIFDVSDIYTGPSTIPSHAAPSSFYAYLNRIINEMNQLQIANINQTISIINDQLFYDAEWQEKTREKQIENARCWCLENGIPFI